MQLQFLLKRSRIVHDPEQVSNGMGANGFSVRLALNYASHPVPVHFYIYASICRTTR